VCTGRQKNDYKQAWHSVSYKIIKMIVGIDGNEANIKNKVGVILMCMNFSKIYGNYRMSGKININS